MQSPMSPARRAVEPGLKRQAGQGQVEHVGPVVIGISGGSCSGKTAIAEDIKRRLMLPDKVTIIKQSSFYKDGSEHSEVNERKYNFDHPDAFDFVLMVNTLKKLRKGESCYIPSYDMETRRRSPRAKKVKKVHVVIFEGIFALYWPQVRELLDLRIFIHEDEDTRLANRLLRGEAEGRDVGEELDHYLSFVKPSYQRYIAPTMQEADLMVPNGSSNAIAKSAIVQVVRLQLMATGVVPLHSSFALQASDDTQPLVHTMAGNTELQGLVDLVVAGLTRGALAREMLVLYCDRVSYLLMEYCASICPGTAGEASPVHISISGYSEVLEGGLHTFCRLARIGKIQVEDSRVCTVRSFAEQEQPRERALDTPPRPSSGTSPAHTPSRKLSSATRNSPSPFSSPVFAARTQSPWFGSEGFDLGPPHPEAMKKTVSPDIGNSTPSAGSGGPSTPQRRPQRGQDTKELPQVRVRIMYLPKNCDDCFCLVMLPVLCDADLVRVILQCVRGWQVPVHRLLLVGLLADEELVRLLAEQHVGLQLVYAKLWQQPQASDLRTLEQALQVKYLGL